MKRTSAELKRLARENLRGHYGVLIGVTIVAGLITYAIQMPFSLILDIYNSVSDLVFYMLVTIFISLLTRILTGGICRMHLKLARKEAITFSDLFSCFTRRPDRFILAALIVTGIELVCMIPGTIFVIAGIVTEAYGMALIGALLFLAATIPLVIVELCFALTLILLADYDSMTTMEALRQSYQLMNGNKGRLFYINLSFLGWAILGVLSCYIGMLWIAPYMTQTSISFYRDVTGELDTPNATNSTVA